MATNIEVIEKIAELGGKVDAQKDILKEVRDLAKESDRAIRGYNDHIGLVARVLRNERVLGWFIGIISLVVTGAVVPQAVYWIKSLF